MREEKSVTEIETKMKHHTVTLFWGGDTKGAAIQITASGKFNLRESIADQIQEEGFIVLTMEEACALCNDLLKFINDEAKRRQALLKDQVQKAKALERTVFGEIASLPISDFAVAAVAVDMVSKFCPKVYVPEAVE